MAEWTRSAPARASMPGLVEKSPLKGTPAVGFTRLFSRSPGIDARAGLRYLFTGLGANKPARNALTVVNVGVSGSTGMPALPGKTAGQWGGGCQVSKSFRLHQTDLQPRLLPSRNLFDSALRPPVREREPLPRSSCL
jgi:hypothetical protein